MWPKGCACAGRGRVLCLLQSGTHSNARVWQRPANGREPPLRACADAEREKLVLEGWERAGEEGEKVLGRRRTTVRAL